LINYIVAMLLLLSTTTLTGSMFFFLYSRNPEDKELKQGFGVFAFIAGILSIILGLHMMTTYPINVPNTKLYIYNEMFGIPFMFFGTISLLIGISMRWDITGKVASLFGFFAAIFNLRYAFNFTKFELTREPQLTMTLYTIASLTGLILPVYFFSKNTTKRYLGYVLGLLLLIVGIIAGIIAWGAIEGHVAEALK